MVKQPYQIAPETGAEEIRGMCSRYTAGTAVHEARKHVARWQMACLLNLVEFSTSRQASDPFLLPSGLSGDTP